MIGALMVATALLVIGFQARLHGGLALGAMAALGDTHRPLHRLVAAPRRQLGRDQPHAGLPGRIRRRHCGGAHLARTLERLCSPACCLRWPRSVSGGSRPRSRRPGWRPTRPTAGCASHTDTGTPSASPLRWACRSASGSALARAAPDRQRARLAAAGALHRDAAAELLARQHRRRRRRHRDLADPRAGASAKPGAAAALAARSRRRHRLGVQPQRPHGRPHPARRPQGRRHRAGPDPARDGGGAVRRRSADPAPRRAAPARRADQAADRNRGDRAGGRDASAGARRPRVQRPRHRRHLLGPLARPHAGRCRDAAELTGPPDRDRKRALDLLAPGNRRLAGPLGRRRRSRLLCAGTASLSRGAGTRQARARLRAADARRPGTDRPRRQPCAARRLGAGRAQHARPAPRPHDRGRRALGTRSASAS